MAKEIIVNSSIDDSTKLQKLIDSTGDIAAKYVFTEDHQIEINSLLRLYNHTEFAGNNCSFTLMENAPTSTFGEGKALIAPKNPLASEDLILHNFTFDGRRDSQSYVEKLYPKPWGHGFHNVIMLGTFGCVGYEHAKNCEIYGINYKNSLGDLLRCEGGTNIIAHDITAYRGGHDVVYVVANGADIYNINAELSVNAAARTRSSKNVKIHDCTLTHKNGIAYAPAIQIQSTAKNWTSSNIEIYNNNIYNTYGPGIQVAASMPNNGLVSVHNNLFVGCGQMPASNKLPGVGGIVFNGHNMDIEYNTFVGNYGYAIAAGNYNVGNSDYYSATISRNIITNTKKSLYAGTASGAGIANLLGLKYSIECSGNDTYGNITNLYQIPNSNGLAVDPLYVGAGDYHLKANSPCRFSGYQLGCYTNTSTETDDSTSIFVHCTKSEADTIVKKYNSNYIIYRSAKS
jgi:hypothetical protein